MKSFRSRNFYIFGNFLADKRDLGACERLLMRRHQFRASIISFCLPQYPLPPLHHVQSLEMRPACCVFSFVVSLAFVVSLRLLCLFVCWVLRLLCLSVCCVLAFLVSRPLWCLVVCCVLVFLSYPLLCLIACCVLAFVSVCCVFAFVVS